MTQLPNIVTDAHVDAVPLTLGPETDHDPSDPDMPPLGSGYETDESASSAESFRTCHESEHRVLER